MSGNTCFKDTMCLETLFSTLVEFFKMKDKTVHSQIYRYQQRSSKPQDACQKKLLAFITGAHGLTHAKQPWCIPKVAHPTRHGSHHRMWYTPKAAHRTSRGSPNQLWDTPKVVYTTIAGLVTNYSSGDSLTVQKVLRSRR